MTEHSYVAPEARWPTLAEHARTLAMRPHGVLATLNRDGHPYTSVVELASLPGGDLLTLLSDLAQHSQNAQADPRTSLLLRAPSEAPLAHPRVSMEGTLTLAPGVDPTLYLDTHPDAERYLNLGDFRFYRLSVRRVYVVAGFGRMGWCDAAAYRAAEPDPLAEVAAGAVQHMNDDHAHNLVDYARAFLGFDDAEHAHMLGLDRYGFDLDVTTQGGTERARISFAEPLDGAAALRPLMVRLAQEARARVERGA